MANTAAEIVWITHLLQELHALPPDRPTLLCDNKSALFMTQNPVSHKHAKHIDLDYHFIRELVHSGKLYTKFVPTNLQIMATEGSDTTPPPLTEGGTVPTSGTVAADSAISTAAHTINIRGDDTDLTSDNIVCTPNSKMSNSRSASFLILFLSSYYFSLVLPMFLLVPLHPEVVVDTLSQ
ncbi:uncharacterized mitochondrial protein-like protein [Tanacetum coccineum]